MKIRSVYPAPAEALPLHPETIGINPIQEPIRRPGGYPYHHWLHTLEGEGEVEAQGLRWKLGERSGILIPPHIPHAYRASGAGWKTGYLTFGGTLAPQITVELCGNGTEKIHWDKDEDRIPLQYGLMLSLAQSGADPSGWLASSEIYRFLTLVRTNGRRNQLPSLSRRLERMRELLNWLEQEYANPDLGLAQMAVRLQIGERQLNERFRELFGQTAYAYLIGIRLRKAKEWLPAFPGRTIKSIAEAVGFRDASHFTAVFRRKEGLTPDMYRRLHGTPSTPGEIGAQRPFSAGRADTSSDKRSE